MESVSVTHVAIFAFIALVLFAKSMTFGLIVALFLLGPVLGIVRGVKNSSTGNIAASLLIPFYGVVYFVVSKPGRTAPQ